MLPVVGNFVLDPTGEQLHIYYGAARHCRFCNVGHACLYGNQTPNATRVPPSSSSVEEITAYATLRRDGFVSLNGPLHAPTSDNDSRRVATSITTVALNFTAADLYVNAMCPVGSAIRVGLRTAQSEVELPDFKTKRCRPVTGDATRKLVSWRASPSIPRINGLARRGRLRLTG